MEISALVSVDSSVDFFFVAVVVVVVVDGSPTVIAPSDFLVFLAGDAVGDSITLRFVGTADVEVVVVVVCSFSFSFSAVDDVCLTCLESVTVVVVVVVVVSSSSSSDSMTRLFWTFCLTFSGDSDSAAGWFAEAAGFLKKEL